jgi:hypothetical protein
MNRSRLAGARARAMAGLAGASALVVGLTTVLSAQPSAIDVASVLERAGQRVTVYFARAQSLVCLERVSLQRLGISWGADGPSRRVESELRLSWDPTPDDPTPKEAKTVRQVIRVNGGVPRKKDYQNCTTPEQNAEEEQPLSILLPQQRVDYKFTADKRETVDGRNAIVLSFQELKKPTVAVSLIKDNEDCVSFDIEGGMRGKIWIDAETHDVLRLDRSLNGQIEIPLPRKATRRGGAMSWTMERWDSSIRFKRVSFQDPEESLILPTSSSSLQITRGSGTPRLRTSTEYVSYRRFMTGGRLVTPPK